MRDDRSRLALVRRNSKDPGNDCRRRASLFPPIEHYESDVSSDREDSIERDLAERTRMEMLEAKMTSYFYQTTRPEVPVRPLSGSCRTANQILVPIASLIN